MKKIVPDPPPPFQLSLEPPAIILPDPPCIDECHALLRELLITLDQTTTLFANNPSGLLHDAMGVNISLLCQMMTALNTHVKTAA
ncbi:MULTISPECIES: hypothetical protein [Pseudomonas]|uniref:DUF3077 domain-containing protein n=1 Tax=Pseudomonas putida TaxID=303 RepID=A0A1B2FCQ9_PSEPU|nr:MULTISPECIES: hypothetical protein [Pseudomonas]ANY90001.1 hypothetical protein IEC33019_4495 [Pseudomonas putida]MCL8307088.1 hypothetical protein [Pseudomonas putida]